MVRTVFHSSTNRLTSNPLSWNNCTYEYTRFRDLPQQCSQQSIKWFSNRLVGTCCHFHYQWFRSSCSRPNRKPWQYKSPKDKFSTVHGQYNSQARGMYVPSAPEEDKCGEWYAATLLRHRWLSMRLKIFRAPLWRSQICSPRASKFTRSLMQVLHTDSGWESTRGPAVHD